MGVITIPKIDLSMVVVEGTGDAQLQAGPGHYPGTPLPGEAGNAAIAGHRTTYLHPFYNLNELVAGDPITIETVQGIFLYHVTSSMAVPPDRRGGGRSDPDADADLDHLQPPLQRQPATGGPRRAGGQHPLPRQSGTGTPSSLRRLPPASPSGHNWWAAILWGVAVAILITAVWAGARRARRGRRALVLAFGLIVWLVVVFFFFQAVAPLLPASY